jgi:hypothetical protein
MMITPTYHLHYLPLLRRGLQSGTASKDDYIYVMPADSVSTGNLYQRPFCYIYLSPRRVTTPLVRATPAAETQPGLIFGMAQVSWIKPGRLPSGEKSGRMARRPGGLLLRQSHKRSLSTTQIFTPFPHQQPIIHHRRWFSGAAAGDRLFGDKPPPR